MRLRPWLFGLAAFLTLVLLLGVGVAHWRSVSVRPPAIPAEPMQLDLQHATAAEWEGLPGVGPALARRIVAERDRRGGFRSSEDLLQVPGIGPRVWERIRRFLPSIPAAPVKHEK